MKSSDENLGFEKQAHTPKEHLEAAASQFMSEGKKRVNQLYEEGVSKANEVEENVKEYSDQLLRKIQKNPLASVLIAGGLGFLLSKLMKK
ncbi:hypothetical protein OQJ18_00810 [Fluoribacter dumoffii]|uniref:Bacterial protein of uncharacterized function (DUF883) n=1 Tax=Fluoribacter dumoffii TaxID=463 RepID=A0A377GCQ2_9GAMM|nr:hypothetical protein [Fluoribacter dumoffii]KTC90610.1 hypothetical protein Ldum_1678 [Fluoribacter dumoffii NY 23]MCW8386289.1 hypothetical protein [Fluoribacter dumoffii]MCW8419342.1 hypothetical protein [Fluoribacter dumoffii]MCW8452783.1 hypothetical protein [Fluoribacter dumoffii]MCW8459967.1 hypothetical protein [Fluoribacter dumoffii]